MDAGNTATVRQARLPQLRFILGPTVSLTTDLDKDRLAVCEDWEREATQSPRVVGDCGHVVVAAGQPTLTGTNGRVR